MTHAAGERLVGGFAHRWSTGYSISLVGSGCGYCLCVGFRKPSLGDQGDWAHCWVLKGQPQWSPDRVVRIPGVWWVFFGPGSGLGRIPHGSCGGCGLVGSGWSGVRWGVCELDSGCEHLNKLLLCSDQVCSLCVSVEGRTVDALVPGADEGRVWPR